MESLVGRACLVASLSCLAAGSGGGSWEWAGVFDLNQNEHYVWSAARNTAGNYADADMKIVIVPASVASDAGLHGAETQATTTWALTPTNANNGGTLVAGSAPTSYRLNFDTRTWVSHFELSVTATGAYAFFCQHLPTEFENGFHYLKTEEGTDVEPVAQEVAPAPAPAPTPAPAPVPCPWSESWEWSGVFDFPTAGWYTWNAARNAAGSYADASMQLVLVAAPNSTSWGLLDTKSDAQTKWTGFANTNSGSILTVGNSYNLVFDTHTWTSHYYFQITSPGAVAFYAQHLPVEFEKEFHYLKDASGTDIEPGAQASVSTCAPALAPSPTPATTTTTRKGDWLGVIMGSILTVVPTLIGVLFIAPRLAGGLQTCLEKSLSIISAFASGVIFAAAVFLLLPEGLHLAGVGQSEVYQAWTWGSCILAGWFSCYLIAGVSKIIEVKSKASAENVAGDEEKNAEAGTLSTFGIVGPVLLGDFFHNFSDGLVIGVAFRVCGASFAWKLVGVTIAHEIPQELADVMILILDGKVRWHLATLANFVSGCSTIIGAIITYSVDAGQNAEGLLLAYGGGVYLFVAVTELAGHLLHPKSSNGPILKQFVLQFLVFIIGTVLMGLVLIGHEHCSAPPPVMADGSPAPAPAGGGHHHH